MLSGSMAACCCKNGKCSDRVAVSCLGRCDLPKHHCLSKDDIGPGPIPGNLGWLYTAKDSPDHQLRCGWRPGHISCAVLRRIEEHFCAVRCGTCFSCTSGCGRPCTRPTIRPCLPKCPPYLCPPPRCPSKVACFPAKICPSKPSCFTSPCPSRSRCFSPCPIPSCFSPCDVPPCTKPMVRIIRHNGQYSITTKPDNITNHPSGPYPLKYVIDTDDESNKKGAKFTIEAKFNDQHFDYTSSQSSFVLDFSPPDNKCYKPCPKKSSVCFPCQNDDGEPTTSCPKCGTPVQLPVRELPKQ